MLSFAKRYSTRLTFMKQIETDSSLVVNGMWLENLMKQPALVNKDASSPKSLSFGSFMEAAPIHTPTIVTSWGYPLLKNSGKESSTNTTKNTEGSENGTTS